MDMEQQTGSKLGEEYIKAVYIHSAYFPYMQSQFSHTVMLDSESMVAAHQASLSNTNYRSLLKLIFIDAIQPSHPLSSPSSQTEKNSCQN